MTVASATSDAVDAEADLLSRARATVGIHRCDWSGMCLGCVECSARLASSPCPLQRWAQSVLDIAAYREVVLGGPAQR